MWVKGRKDGESRGKDVKERALVGKGCSPPPRQGHQEAHPLSGSEQMSVLLWQKSRYARTSARYCF